MRKFLIGTVVVIVLLYLAGGLLLSRGKELGERHHDFDEAEFDYSTGSFDDYIVYSRERLQAARTARTDNEVLANILPAELPPPADCPRSADGRAEQGVLLIHGLLDSPYSMQDLARSLQSQCMHVFTLLLPDHGSRPGDMLSTDWHEWAQAVSLGVSALAQKAERVILSGHSAGGALSIHEAERNDEVDALVLFAPALAITPSAKFARYVESFGMLFPKAAWFGLEPDEALYRYESLTFSAATQTQALIEATLDGENEKLRQLPILAIASVEDTTVFTSATEAFMARNRNPDSELLLYSQYEYPTGERLRVIPSAAPERGVLSFSHLGLMTAPSHAYYGYDGAYRSCGHYGSADNPDFVACKNGERSFYGEATAANLEQGLVERIAFNPYYEAMLGEVLAFLKRSAP